MYGTDPPCLVPDLGAPGVVGLEVVERGENSEKGHAVDVAGQNQQEEQLQRDVWVDVGRWQTETHYMFKLSAL
jgi:hypothetical protein